MLDETHRAEARSWVISANGHADFPIQNLPLCIFSVDGNGKRLGIAIGDSVLDVSAIADGGLLIGDAADGAKAADGSLNGLFALGANPRKALRRQVFALLLEGAKDAGAAQRHVYTAAACTLHMPAKIGGYTDFYAGIRHAMNVGRLFRPDNPLLPNYKYVPIGYHGRTSSVRVSGGTVVRPNGQRKRPEEAEPSFGPCRNLDYELELGFWISQGNSLGTTIPIAEAGDHIAGVCLLNDWSARDIQAWEYQPLGPFLAKNFHTTISPWVVTAEALAPYRTAQPSRPAGDPAPLPYLLNDMDQKAGAFDICMEAFLIPTGNGATEYQLSSGSSLAMYWTPGQLVAHHTSGGCNLEPGDLLGSGTISGETPNSRGSLLELTGGGKESIDLADGDKRTFLKDGDTVIFRGHCVKNGFARIGFGVCQATVAPAPV